MLNAFSVDFIEEFSTNKKAHPMFWMRFLFFDMSREGFEPSVYGLTYHYGFHHQYSVCGLDSLLTFTLSVVRSAPLSLYTFPIFWAWLGIGILNRSPNLKRFTYSISTIVLLLKSVALTRLSYRDVLQPN